MKLYFTPFACSLATRIAIDEAELDAEFIQVKRDQPLPDGRDFLAISPMGYVPAMESGSVTLTEGPAVLTYIADLAAEGVLAPAPYTAERYELTKWLNFISTELHKAVFAPLFGAGNEGAKEHARHLIAKRFDLLSRHLDGRSYLLGTFSVADAYLFAVLNWSEFVGVPIADWPVLKAWRDGLRARPSVARAIATEMPLRQAA